MRPAHGWRYFIALGNEPLVGFRTSPPGGMEASKADAMMARVDRDRRIGSPVQ